MNQRELEATKKFSSNAHMKTRKEVKSTLDSLISSKKSDLVKGQLTEQRATFSRHQIGAAAYKKVNVMEGCDNILVTNYCNESRQKKFNIFVASQDDKTLIETNCCNMLRFFVHGTGYMGFRSLPQLSLNHIIRLIHLFC